MKSIGIFFTLLTFIFITACSEDTSSNTTASSVITSANAQDLAIAATEGTKQSVNTNSAKFLKTSATPFDTSTLSKTIIDQTQQATDIGSLPTLFDNLCNSGSSTPVTTIDNTGATIISITFVDCDLSATGAILNGVVTVTITAATNGDTNFNLIYNNFTVNYQGNIETINFSMQCNITSTFQTSCTSSSNILGIDGRNYLISNISVSGDSSSGFNVSATVTDPDHGNISIKASNVLFDCAAPDAGRPSTGSIIFTSNGENATVIFDSCSTYTVTVNGVATSYTWP